jgi:predicted O-methyltransferase YrrM
MNLTEIGQKYNSDKGYLHSYYEVYDIHFNRLRGSAKNVLEIGTYAGESLLVWREYFSKANIFGVDNYFKPSFHSENRIKFELMDAYCEDSVSKLSREYDVIIDDGPHTLESQIFFVEKYLPLLAKNGVMVIEDILSLDAAMEISKSFPKELRRFVFSIDRRVVPGVDYSSILIVFDRYE